MALTREESIFAALDHLLELDQAARDLEYVVNKAGLGVTSDTLNKLHKAIMDASQEVKS